MRPLHALFLIVALAGLLVAGLLLFKGEVGVGQVAPAVPEPHAAAPSGERKAETALHSPGDTDAPARSEAPVALARPEAAADAATKTSALAAAALTGRIVDARGAPVRDARIYAVRARSLEGIPLENLDPAVMPWARRSEAKSDAEGRFRITPEVNGDLRLGVRAHGFAPLDRAETARTGSTDIGDIVLEDGAVLSGFVRDSGGRPVEGAVLRRLDAGDSTFAFLGTSRGVEVATTDRSGAFRIDEIASGAWKLLITSEAHPDKIEQGETDRPGKVVAGLEFVLEDGTEIQGRVVNVPAAEQSLLKDFWVHAVPKRSGGDEMVTVHAGEGDLESGRAPRRARCAADGSFTVRGLRQDESYRLAARDGERDFFGRTRTKWTEARSGDRGVELLYKPETALVFQVVDGRTSEPVTELDVRAGLRFMMPVMGENGRVQRSFPDGRVRFGNLPDPREGEATKLVIEARGYKELRLNDLMLVAGQDLDLGVVRLERAPMVEVLVLDRSSGLPVADARVTLAKEKPADVHEVNMIIEDGEDEETAIGTSRSRRVRTDKDGRARVNSLPGERATLSVTHSSFAPYESEAMLLPVLDDHQVTVRLEVGGTVTIELVDAHGTPVPGMTIQHEGPGESGAMMNLGPDEGEKTDSQGRSVFAHLQPGVHRFKADDSPVGSWGVGENIVVRSRRSGGDAPHDASWSEIAVVEKGEHVLRLVAPARSTLRGVVTESGKPLAGATVRLSEKDNPMPMLPMFGGSGLEARTNGKGEYTIEKVKVGEYVASVTHDTRSMAFESEVKIRDDANELDVDLPLSVIEGRLLDEEDHPIAGVRVRAERAQPDAGPRRQQFQAIMVTNDGDGDTAVSVSSGESAGDRVFSDAEGRYVLRGVLSDVDLVVKASAKDFQPKESELVRVAPDQVKSHVDMKLVRGATLEVKVVRGDGRAGSECLVHATPDGASSTGEPKIELTGAKGVARFTGLKPGKWRIRAEAIGGVDGGDGEQPAAPEQTIDVKLGDTNTASFTVP